MLAKVLIQRKGRVDIDRSLIFHGERGTPEVPATEPSKKGLASENQATQNPPAPPLIFSALPTQRQAGDA
jgi:hypothetical protein